MAEVWNVETGCDTFRRRRMLPRARHNTPLSSAVNILLISSVPDKAIPSRANFEMEETL